MEPNEQTEITRKIETDSEIESRMTAKVVGGGSRGLSKKEKGPVDMDSSAGGRGYKGTKW